MLWRRLTALQDTHHAMAKLKAISAEGEVVSVDTAARTASTSTRKKSY